MALIAERKTSKDFEIPAEGTIQAVICEIEDRGLVDRVFNGIAKKNHEIRLWWQLNSKDSEGKTFYLPENFTLSLHEKSKLYKRVKGLYGKEPPQTLDVSKLIGTNTQLVIVRNEGKDKMGETKLYANVAATLKLAPGQAKLEIVPRPKRDEVKAAVAQTLKSNAITEAAPITDDDIPF